MSNQLDRSRPFGRTLGDSDVCFKQDGLDFDSRGNVIPGSKNSGAAQIAKHIEEKADVVRFEDMSLPELKKHAETVITEMENAGETPTRVKGGNGVKKRLIEFLNENA